MGKTAGLAYEGQLVTVKENGQQVTYALDTTAENGLRRVGSDPSQVCSDVSTIVENYISTLTVSDISAASGKIVDKIWETNGKISATYRTLTTSEVSGLDDAIASIKPSLSVTVESLETPIADDAKTYVVKQGGLSVGTYISIPKDKVFESAFMVTVTGEPTSPTTATLTAFTVKYDNITAHILSDDTGTKSDEPSLTAFADGTFSSIKNAYFGKEGGDGPYLRITVSHQDVPIYIAMPKLVDTYIGKTTDTIKVDISNREISAHLLDNAVTEAKISADAVTTAKIKDGNVTSEKIGTGEVKTSNIQDDAVTNAKIADSAVATD